MLIVHVAIIPFHTFLSYNLKSYKVLKHKITQQCSRLNLLSLLDESNLIFCCMGSRGNYFWLVDQQNNNNPQFQSQHIKKLKIFS